MMMISTSLFSQDFITVEEQCKASIVNITSLNTQKPFYYWDSVQKQVIANAESQKKSFGEDIVWRKYGSNSKSYELVLDDEVIGFSIQRIGSTTHRIWLCANVETSIREW